MDKSLVKRNLQIGVEQTENNTITFSCASATPYLRTDDDFSYYEVLEISEKAIDFQRLIDCKSPLLFEHNTEKQIGVVQHAWIQNQKLYVTVKFSENDFAQEILKDIKDGIRRNVSIGYMITQTVMEKQTNDFPIIHVVNWMPYEVSIVSVPADANVGINRSHKGNKTMEISQEDFELLEKFKKFMAAEETPVEETIEETPVEEVKAEEVPVQEEVIQEEVIQEQTVQEEIVQEVKAEQTVEEEQTINEDEEIKAMGELADEEQLAEQFIKAKRSLEDFKKELQHRSVNNINKVQNKEHRSMEKKYFSISKAIRNACSQYKGDISKDYETEVVNENKRNFGIQDADIVITRSQLRALAANGKGKELINTDYLPQEYTPVDRPQTTLEKTGFHTLPVNGGPVSFSVQVSGTVAAMTSLDGELTATDAEWKLKTLTPKKGGAVVQIPYSLLLQANPEIDAMIETDITNALYELRDIQALVGDGTGNNLTGITATAGVNTIAAAYTWAGVCEAIKKIRDNNIYTEDLAWVMNSNDYLKFETTLKDATTGYGGFILEDGKIKGYPVYINNALPNGGFIVGAFGELVVADFDGITIKVDDITGIKKQAVNVVCFAAFDGVVRKPGAFTKAVAE